MIRGLLEKIVAEVWIKLCKGEIIENNFVIEEPPKNIDADFATNVCFQGAKLLKESPVKIAEKFIELVRAKGKVEDTIIEDVFIAGPGFVNFVIKKDVFIKEALNLHKNNEYIYQVKNPQKILIEFVSANPTGPLHIGHARGAAIGDCLSRILAKVGHTVDKEYYVNNAGNQIDVLADTLEIRYRQLLGEKVELKPESYKGEYMIDIGKKILHKNEMHKYKNENENESENKNNININFNINFREIVVDEILKIIGNDLKRFNIDFNNWFLETSLFENQQYEKATQALKKSGHLKLKDGAWWLVTEELEDDDKDRVVIRKDGRPTYFAADIAYHANKYSRGYDRLIDIWGADHHGYVARIKAAVSYLGYEKDDLSIILYNLVSLSREGKKVAMSTRSGEFVPLEEVIDEVGTDAARFFLLMRDGNSQLDFDLELAKQKSSDNPVYYVQYARARIFSILKNAKVEPSSDDFEQNIKEPEEINLIKHILNFSEIVNLCAKDFNTHHITAYLLELASTFHNYYAKHKISEDPARLLLCMMIAEVIKEGLDILGVSAPESM